MRKPKVLLLVVYEVEEIGDPETKEGIFTLAYNYYAMTEGIERLTKYIESKGFSVDVVACDVQTDFNKPQPGKWVWLYKRGKRENYLKYERKIVGEKKKELKTNWKEINTKLITNPKPADLSEYDFFGVSMMTDHWYSSMSLRRYFKALFAQLREKIGSSLLILGGAGVWEFGKSAMKSFKEIDAAIIGWGEFPFAYVLKEAASKGLKSPLKYQQLQSILKHGQPPAGIFFRYLGEEKEEIVFTGTHKKKFEEIPMEWALFEREPRDILYLSTLEGCPHGKCNFCWWGQSVEYRPYPIKDVVQRILEAKPAQIRIYDSCMLTSCRKGVERVEELCRYIIEMKKTKQLKPEMSITLPARADGFRKMRIRDQGYEIAHSLRNLLATIWETKDLDKLSKLQDMFDNRFEKVKKNLPILLKVAGVQQIYVGIESASDRDLKEMNKGTTVEDNLKVLEVCESMKIGVDASFIMACPNSTLEDVIKTIAMAFYASKIGRSASVNAYIFIEKNTPFCRNPDIQKRYKPLRHRKSLRTDDEIIRWLVEDLFERPEGHVSIPAHIVHADTKKVIEKLEYLWSEEKRRTDRDIFEDCYGSDAAFFRKASKKFGKGVIKEMGDTFMTYSPERREHIMDMMIKLEGLKMSPCVDYVRDIASM